MGFIKKILFILLLMLSVISNSSSDDKKTSEQLIKEFIFLKKQASNAVSYGSSSKKQLSKGINTDNSPITSNYEKIDCGELSDPILVSFGDLGDDTVECGRVVVPADWSAMNGKTIKLAVYRIPSTSPTPAPDPVVYLAGGPGQSGVSALRIFAKGSAAYLRSRSDVIIIDQRGTGYSEPALFCPEVFTAPVETIALHQACHDRLVSEGVRFADYNSAYNAQDVNAVRQALGYTEWNLYGVSYGTRLALTAMRDLPTGIRSVVLDSVFPVDINSIGSNTPYSVYWAIKQISTNCAADADCSSNIGNIKGVIEDGIMRLSAMPDGNLLAIIYVSALTKLINDPLLADRITTVATGTDAEVKTLIQQTEESLLLPPISTKAPPVVYPFVTPAAQGMFSAVICSEEKPYINLSATPNIASNFREPTQRIINQVGQSEQLLCDIYKVPARDEIETQPVQSDLPTLVLAGTADAITPPTFAIHATETLSHSQYAEFEGLGHGLLGQNECIKQITLDFLNNPNLAADQSCIDSLPQVDYITNIQ